MSALHAASLSDVVVFYVLWLEKTSVFLMGLQNPDARFISAVWVPACTETLESESGAG